MKERNKVLDGGLNILDIVGKLVLIVVMAVVWYPFFKVYDNQLLAQEQENAAAASAKDTE